MVKSFVSKSIGNLNDIEIILFNTK